MILEFKGKFPRISKNVFIHETAVVIGNVEIGDFSSIFPNAVVRGDRDKIVIGRYVNVQDNVTIHVSEGYSVYIGDYTSIGHNAVIHGCKIGENVLIGMNAVVMNGAEIGSNSIVGACALVTENKKFPERSLIIGVPARVVRELSEEEVEMIRKNAEIYRKLAEEYMR